MRHENSGKEWTRRDDDTLVAALRAGDSAQQAAEACGRSTTAVTRRARFLLPDRDRHRADPINRLRAHLDADPAYPWEQTALTRHAREKSSPYRREPLPSPRLGFVRDVAGQEERLLDLGVWPWTAKPWLHVFEKWNAIAPPEHRDLYPPSPREAADRIERLVAEQVPEKALLALYAYLDHGTRSTRQRTDRGQALWVACDGDLTLGLAVCTAHYSVDGKRPHPAATTALAEHLNRFHVPSWVVFRLAQWCPPHAVDMLNLASEPSTVMAGGLLADQDRDADPRRMRDVLAAVAAREVPPQRLYRWWVAGLPLGRLAQDAAAYGALPDADVDVLAAMRPTPPPAHTHR